MDGFGPRSFEESCSSAEAKHSRRGIPIASCSQEEADGPNSLKILKVSCSRVLQGPGIPMTWQPRCDEMGGSNALASLAWAPKLCKAPLMSRIPMPLLQIAGKMQEAVWFAAA